MSLSRKRKLHRSFDEKAHRNRLVNLARADNVANFIEFFKENFTYGDHNFTTFIWDLTSPIVSLGCAYTEPDSPPSLVVNIVKEFFDLLKNTPELPPQIVKPFKDIMGIYGAPSHEIIPIPEAYIQECNKVVDKFISDNKINAELATSIKLFFSNVVSILIDFTYKKHLLYNINARGAVKTRMDSICSILGVLIHLIATTTPYHKIIQGFTIDDLIKYGKAERDRDIGDLKLKNKNPHMSEFEIVQELIELNDQRHADRAERRRQRKRASEEGGRRLKMRSIKRRTNKKHSYKKKYK
jgi:hypothetical protein